MLSLRSSIFVFCTSLAVAGVCPVTSRADLIYAAAIAGQNGIFAIDPDTQTVTMVQSFAALPYDISAGPSPQTLYLTFQGGAALYSFDLTGTGLHSIGGGFQGNSLGEGRDGYLYYGGPSFGRIDPATGIATQIAEGPFSYVGDIATSPSGVTYGVLAEGLETVDRTSGALSLVNQLSVGGLWGLAFTQDGRMWGATPNGWLYEVDPTTAAITPIFDTGLNIYDLASEPAPVPSPGAFLLTLLWVPMNWRSRRPCDQL